MQQSMILKSVALAVVTAAASADAQTLRGSAASVDLMYTTAQMRDLQFLRTTDDVYSAVRAGTLKLISVTEDLDIEKTAFPFVLPNTLRFADSLAAQYHAGCGERIVVTSGARPIDKQPRNASPKSVHPTGMAIDFRRPKTPVCLEWLRKSLIALEDAHVVEATEEKHPPHFHVAVLKQSHVPHIQMAAGEVAVPATTDTATTRAKSRESTTAAKATSSTVRQAKSARLVGKAAKRPANKVPRKSSRKAHSGSAKADKSR
jgi:hypothetical protein